MRSHIFRIIIVLLFFLAGCAPYIENRDSKGSNIICFGDSITYGLGAPEGEDYPARLSELLNRDVINAGVSGDTTAEALERLREDVLQRNPYIVIAQFGGNDFLRKIPKEDTLKNMEEIISGIQDSGAMVALCDPSGGIVLGNYRKGYKRLAKKTGSIFIPGLLEKIIRNPSLKSDYIHPNAKGYKIIAEKICERIKKYTR